MAFITLIEVIDIIIMSVFIGYIFSGSVKVEEEDDYEPLTEKYSFINWKELKFAIMVTAPAVILHEFAHKFVAMGFGLDAIFRAFYHSTFTLALGIFSLIAKLTGLGFTFFVPGYVQISCSAAPCYFTPLTGTLIAFSGPFLNLVLWVGTWALLRSNAKIIKRRKTYAIIHLTKNINMFLFIFNMIPIPGFDGYKVFEGLIQAFL